MMRECKRSEDFKWYTLEDRLGFQFCSFIRRLDLDCWIIQSLSGSALGRRSPAGLLSNGQGRSWEIPSKKISFAENWAVALEKIIGGDLFLTTMVIGEVGWQGRIRRRRMIKGKMPQEFACSCLADSMLETNVRATRRN